MTRCSQGVVAVCFLAALSVLCGCPARGSVRTNAIEQEIHATDEDELRRCAPRELALAHVHARFAQIEMDEANEPRALEHVFLAEQNLHAAQWLSDNSRCAPRRTSLPLEAATSEVASDAGPASDDVVTTAD